MHMPNEDLPLNFDLRSRIKRLRQPMSHPQNEWDRMAADMRDHLRLDGMSLARQMTLWPSLLPGATRGVERKGDVIHSAGLPPAVNWPLDSKLNRIRPLMHGGHERCPSISTCACPLRVHSLFELVPA
jgi:hypothetical protein